MKCKCLMFIFSFLNNQLYIVHLIINRENENYDIFNGQKLIIDFNHFLTKLLFVFQELVNYWLLDF